jgi:hypothetical protein
MKHTHTTTTTFYTHPGDKVWKQVLCPQDTHMYIGNISTAVTLIHTPLPQPSTPILVTRSENRSFVPRTLTCTLGASVLQWHMHTPLPQPSTPILVTRSENRSLVPRTLTCTLGTSVLQWHMHTPLPQPSTPILVTRSENKTLASPRFSADDSLLVRWWPGVQKAFMNCAAAKEI